MDLFAAVKRTAPQLRSGAVGPSLGTEVEGSGPAESWRGSGLAEDVGVSRRWTGEEEETESDEVRQRRMDEAARELGLPEPGERGTPR
jgi:hypothetical protein